MGDNLFIFLHGEMLLDIKPPSHRVTLELLGGRILSI